MYYIKDKLDFTNLNVGDQLLLINDKDEKNIKYNIYILDYKLDNMLFEIFNHSICNKDADSDYKLLLKCDKDYIYSNKFMLSNFMIIYNTIKDDDFRTKIYTYDNDNYIIEHQYIKKYNNSYIAIISEYNINLFHKHISTNLKLLFYNEDSNTCYKISDFNIDDLKKFNSSENLNKFKKAYFAYINFNLKNYLNDNKLLKKFFEEFDLNNNKEANEIFTSILKPIFNIDDYYVYVNFKVKFNLSKNINNTISRIINCNEYFYFNKEIKKNDKYFGLFINSLYKLIDKNGNVNKKYNLKYNDIECYIIEDKDMRYLVFKKYDEGFSLVMDRKEINEYLERYKVLKKIRKKE